MSTDHAYRADGVLEEQDEQTVIRFERRLAHPIDRVWAALTEPEQLASWWAEAEVELVEGGRFDMRWLNSNEAGERFTMKATIVRLEPPYLLETRGEPHGLLRWELRSDGPDSTVLSFVNSVNMAGGEVPDKYRTGARTGWHYHLDALAEYLRGGGLSLADLPNEQWYEIHARYAAQAG
jgi:uncharacterized protein YndB with AHSA1/START domain